MEEYKISEFFIDLKENQTDVFKIQVNTEKYGWLKCVNEQNNNNFFNDSNHDLSGNAIILFNKVIFKKEIDCIINFLEMNENLFENTEPKINRFNKAILIDLEKRNILKILRNSEGEILTIYIADNDLLENEYFNVRYKVNSNITSNIQNITNDNSVNISNSNIESSKIQVNSNIVENNIKTDITSYDNKKDIISEPKDKVLNNKEGKSKFKNNIRTFLLWIIGGIILAIVNEYISNIVDIFKKILSNL